MHAKSLQLCATLQRYGLKLTRLLCPGDSPGKNREGCRALLQGIFPTQVSNAGLSSCSRRFTVESIFIFFLKFHFLFIHYDCLFLLSFLKISIIKSLSANSNIEVIQGLFLLTTFFLILGHIFLCPYMSNIYFFNSRHYM